MKWTQRFGYKPRSSAAIGAEHAAPACQRAQELGPEGFRLAGRDGVTPIASRRSCVLTATAIRDDASPLRALTQVESSKR